MLSFEVEEMWGGVSGDLSLSVKKLQIEDLMSHKENKDNWCVLYSF